MRGVFRAMAQHVLHGISGHGAVHPAVINRNGPVDDEDVGLPDRVFQSLIGGLS